MAKLYSEIPSQFENNKIAIPIYVDTENKVINTFEVKLQISNNLIFRDWLEKYSIISLWVEKPNIKDNIITFSGIIPGGFIGKKGKLIDLLFETKDSSYYQVKILPTSQAFLNDGYGTKITPKVASYKFLITEVNMARNLEVDKFPPEHFNIYLYRSKELFDDKYFIVFEAKDKQSGIAYYEITESPMFMPSIIYSESSFRKINPPYILNDQSLRSYVYVKAVDKFGNKRIEVLKPHLLFEESEIISLVVFISLVLILIKFFLDKIKLKNLKWKII